jgi:hypothetical protein
MHMTYTSTTLMLAAALLAGCGAFPSQVKKVPIPDEHGAYNLSEVKEYIGVSPLEHDQKRLLNQTALYAGTWNKAASDLRLERDIGNNGQFIMTLAGAYNVARSRLTPGKWWLAGAGGTGLILDRYQIDIQATHYEQAADAMLCARAAIADVSETFWKIYDENGQISAVLSDIPPEATDDRGVGYETLSDLFLTINTKLGVIASRLRKNLNSDKLKPPSADEITKAVTAKQQTESSAGGAAQTISDHVKEKVAALSSINSQEQARKFIEDAAKVDSDVQAGKLTPNASTPGWSSLSVSKQRSLLRDKGLNSEAFVKEKEDSGKLSLISTATWKKAILLPVTLDNCLPKAGS